MMKRNSNGRSKLAVLFRCLRVVALLILADNVLEMIYRSFLDDSGARSAGRNRAVTTCPSPRSRLEFDNEQDMNTEPRILLYVTSHLPTSHEELLHRCWPYVLSNSKLVQMADVKVFLTGELYNQYADGEVFRYIFREKIRRNQFSMHQVENPGYQEGAIAAMAMGQKNGWFEGYDWVIRLNADVIIKDDTILLATIMSSKRENVAGIFVDCYKKCDEESHCDKDGYLIHSDFTAFKPSTLSPTLQWNEDASSAEKMNNFAFQSVVAQCRDRWLLDSFPNVGGYCRLSTDDSASVSHFGDEVTGTAQRCVEWFKERNMTLNSIF